MQIVFVQMRVYISVQISHVDNLYKKGHKLQEVLNSIYYAITMRMVLAILELDQFAADVCRGIEWSKLCV